MKKSSTLVRRTLVSALFLSCSLFAFGQEYRFNVTKLLDTLIKNPEYVVEAQVINKMRKEGKYTDEYILKFVDDKYGKPRAMKAKLPKFNTNLSHKQLYTTSSCNNNDIGVEAGNFASWQGEIGNLNSTGSLPPCQAAPFTTTPLPLTGRIEIVSSATGSDPCADVPGFPINLPSPTGGQYSIKLGNMQVNAQTERIIHQFVVQPTDTNFIYNYAVVFEDPGHLPSNQPFFDFVILDQNNDTIPCSYQHYVGGPGLPGFQTSNMGPSCPGSGLSTVYYKPWTTVGVHLKNYINQQVKVICTTGDCSQCGHFGLAYLDFSCGTSSPSQYCISSTGVVLVAPIEPGATYSWSTGSTNDSITVNPQVTDTVILTVMLPGGCDYVVPYVLQPTVMQSGFTYTVSCNSASFTDTTFISGGTISTWQWSFPGGTPSSFTGQNPPTISYPPGGTYNVTLQTTSQAGCVDTSVSVQVTIPPAPIIDAGPNQTICTGTGNVQLCGSGGVSYVWQPGGQSASCIVVTPPFSPYTYSLTGTDANGCTGTDVVTLTINPIPAVNGGNPQTICFGQTTAQLNATTNAVNPTYTWVPSAGLSNPNIQNPVASPGFSSTYTVYVTDANGCTGAGTTTVTVGAIPYISAIASPTICVGDSAILNANVSNVPSAQLPVSWNWNPPNALNNANLQNPTSGAVTTTTYVVTVTDAYGCKDDTSTVLYVNTVPSISFADWVPDLTCDGYIIPWKANVSSNGQSVIWYFGDGTSLTTYAPNTNGGPHAYPFNGTYIVTAIVFNGACTDTIDTTLVVDDLSSFLTVLPPNVFTPNNDNMNDCFLPVFMPMPGSGISPDTLKTLKECVTMEVWDRWGVKMFETTDTEKCWDGKNMKGHPVKDGTYYYVAKFGNEIIKGHVAVLRKTN